MSVMKYMTILFVGLGLYAFVSVVVRFLRSKYAPVKTVKAVVVNKQVIETFSRHSATGKAKKHAVTFLANGKRLSFYVSEFSYKGYRMNESGTLKYKGERIVEFR